MVLRLLCCFLTINDIHDISILKLNMFGRPSDFRIIEQNNNLHVLVNNSRIPQPIVGCKCKILSFWTFKNNNNNTQKQNKAKQD